MRQPTSPDSAYRWWRDALAGKKPPIHHGEPQCGYYMRRLIAKGPFVPASIYLEQFIAEGQLTSPEVMHCEVNGKRCDVEREWTWLAGHPISEDQYMQMVSGSWAQPDPPPPPSPTAAIKATDTPY